MAVLQTSLPFAPWMHPGAARLPGIMPAGPDDWLSVDEAFAGQMAERDRLIAATPDTVHALLPEAEAAADELLDMALDRLARMPGFAFGRDGVRRPDGAVVALDRAAPLLTLGRLVQEDLCLLQRGAEEHRLTGAILCFPASWTLAEKIGRPLVGIHDPVPEYGPRIATSVQRMFDRIRVGTPMFRANALDYDDPDLHQPRREGEARPRPLARTYVRSERQTLMRLPRTGAVVFAIHTHVVRLADLDPAVRVGFEESMASRHPPAA